MTAPWYPQWDDFLVMRTSARWVGDKAGADQWVMECQAFPGSAGTRVVVFGRLKVFDANHEMATSVGLASKYLGEDAAERLKDPEFRKEVTFAANELVYDRAFSVAMASAALVGVALTKRWLAPPPEYEEG